MRRRALIARPCFYMAINQTSCELLLPLPLPLLRLDLSCWS